MEDGNRRCEERKELERLIWNCVQALSYCSNAISQLARSEGPTMPSDFELMRSEYRAALSRLKVLRECLGLHLKFHECADLTTRSETLAIHIRQNLARETDRGISLRSEGQAA